jgi:glyoxylase-like metal-dependent hydrolase (beta-lactamase superfamily II)
MAENVYEVAENKKGFWTIDEGGVRSFLIEGAEKALLVDTGFGKGDIKSLAEGLTQKPIILVNTHTDGDHIGCNKSFDKAYLHPLEIERYPIESDTELVPIEEGYIFDLGGKKYEVLETPGHTPGSIMLINRKERQLISGDSLGLAAIFMFGEHRDIHKYIDTMEKLKSKITDIDEVWPSHGPCPIKTDVIDELIDGAKKLEAGELEGKKPPFEIPAKLYEYKRVKFLYK